MNNILLTIENEGVVYCPVVNDGITLDLTLEGSPGKLDFKVINDGKINFQEGNRVTLIIDGVNVFLGYVFTKKRDKEQVISVTAYDQLRYLKNKDYLKYSDKKASELITMISAYNGLKCGDIEDTGHVMSRREDNTTFFDMIKNALGETLRVRKKLYVLYDDFGKLTLKAVENMKVDCLVSGDTAENFSYESSIDKETYNMVKLIYENDETKTRDVFITKDSGNIGKWGLLQYFEVINKGDDGVTKAEAMLKLYNSKRRVLSISGVLGDLRVRAGCLIPVMLTLGDIDAKSFLLVESVKHSFESGAHTMDLGLRV